MTAESTSGQWNTLAQLFASTPECRRLGGNFRHPMHEIITILFLARLRNVTSSRKTAIWANENIDELRRHGLELRHGVPSHHTFSRVLAKMPPTVLKALERRWSEELRRRVAGTFVAVDGKALTHASTDGVHVPYVVSAWACEGGFVMGEVKTDVKSNEITALPVLLTTLGRELEGCTVSIDAAGCQKNIARQIVKGNGADYILGLKGNQKNMHGEFLELFDKCRKMYPDRFVEHTTVEKNGGRFEQRHCVQTDYVEWFAEFDQWIGLRSVILVESERSTAKKGAATDRRLYASSLSLDAEKALAGVRAHWGVENGLHWTLDVIFGEDDCRAKADNAAENRSTLLHLAVGVLKQVGKKTGQSVDGVSFKASCSQSFLFDLVFAKEVA